MESLGGKWVLRVEPSQMGLRLQALSYLLLPTAFCCIRMPCWIPYLTCPFHYVKMLPSVDNQLVNVLLNFTATRIIRNKTRYFINYLLQYISFCQHRLRDAYCILWDIIQHFTRQYLLYFFYKCIHVLSFLH